MAKALDHQTALTPAQKLRVAVAVLLEGMDQHRVAALMGVNPGRVNTACKDIARAAGLEQPPAVDPSFDFGARLLTDQETGLSSRERRVQLPPGAPPS